ncbi:MULTISPECIES: fructosamine kinase family protein [Streptomyces]|uniref:Fructosamine kinase family protein n=1 Tax=Streptomyces doebereineriae TaxID=3075528 RepID=A0ABU2VGB2_9ACTN|nr:fructosamine kinase family protein [Streptomyces sp. DSM 41640]MDT0484627.1 fructosamine kinase family protein [Streptomyces sp. DSM 41640]
MKDRWQSLPSSVVPHVADAVPLSGGAVNDVWRLTLDDSTTYVLKGSTDAPADLFPLEAAGLAALQERAGIRTPRVFEVSAHHLLMEALRPRPDTETFWEAASRAFAKLHAVRGERFGWDTDGWLGLLPQENTWTDDGHEFFAEHRIRRYLREPKVRRALEPADLAGLERICERLPQLVPAAPSVLNHGDLWRGNLVADAAGEPVFIDPAVCWAWAESDLSMIYCCDPPPERFFRAYEEITPLTDGWQDRMPLLHLREHLSVLAHFGAYGDAVAHVRDVVRVFS